jgi:hypothetical protein
VDIIRYGSQRYRGTKYLFRNLRLRSGEKWQNNVRWDTGRKQVAIQVNWIPHDDGKTNHTYCINLSPDDVSALLAILAHAGSASDAELLRKHLAKQVPALVKLLACATGLTPVPMPEDTKADAKQPTNCR